MKTTAWSEAFLSIFVIAAATTGLAAATGCSQATTADGSTSDEKAGASEDQVVGVTNLDPVARALNLTRGQAPQSSQAQLEDGTCYKALIKNPLALQAEFRRYDNGAAFFARKDVGPSSGDKRPVLCVDLHGGLTHAASFSGAALDAIFRYDLGVLQAWDLPTRWQEVWHFDNGSIQMAYGFPEEDRMKSVSSKVFEQPIDVPMTAGGLLEQITLNNVALSNSYTAPTTHNITIRGSFAAFTYRAAFRKDQDTSQFDLENDAIGVFDRTGFEHGWESDRILTLHFKHTDITESTKYASTVEWKEGLVVYKKTDHALNRSPVAECTRNVKQSVTSPYACTGI